MNRGLHRYQRLLRDQVRQCRGQLQQCLARRQEEEQVQEELRAEQQRQEQSQRLAGAQQRWQRATEWERLATQLNLALRGCKTRLRRLALVEQEARAALTAAMQKDRATDRYCERLQARDQQENDRKERRQIDELALLIRWRDSQGGQP